MKKLIVLTIVLTSLHVDAKVYQPPKPTQTQQKQNLAHLIQHLYRILDHDPIKPIDREIKKRRAERPRDLIRIRELKMSKQIARAQQDLQKFELLREIRETMRKSSNQQIIKAMHSLSGKLEPFPRATLFAYMAAFAKPEEQKRLSDIYTHMYIDPRTTSKNYDQFAGELHKQGTNIFKRATHDHGLTLEDMQQIFGGNDDSLPNLKAFAKENPELIAKSMGRINPSKHAELMGFYEYVRREVLGTLNKNLDSAIKNTRKKLNKLKREASVHG